MLRRWALGLTLWVAVVAAAAMVPASSAGRGPAGATSFVAASPLSQANELVRYSLADGRRLGVLVRIPTLPGGGSTWTVSTPYLLFGGDYVITLGRDGCSGRCGNAAHACVSEVERLDPASGRARTLFSVSRRWVVDDAVPSPDGRSVALVESSCGTPAASELAIRDLSSGRTRLVTRQLSACGIASDVAWNANSTALAFADARRPDIDNPPLRCGLAIAPAAGVTGPRDWTLIRSRASCGFASSAYDATGLVAVEDCNDGEGGLTTALVQYDGRDRIVARHGLDGFDPPQYGIAAQVEADPAAHAVLVSEVISDDPDVSDVWTFNGTSLRRVGDYFGDAILAEP